MKVTHISTFDYGGAGGAAARTHIHLLNAGINSKLLVLDKKNDHPSSFHYKGWSNIRDKTLPKRIFNKLKRRYYHKLTHGKINGLPKGYELFSFPISSYNVEDHPLVQQADIIVLHWVAGFINFPSFFKKVRQPIVWRLPDMFPFTGGYHYEKGFPFKAYQSLIDQNLIIKEKALKDTSLHLVPLCRWMDKKIDTSIFNRFPRTIIPNGLNTQTFKPRNQQFSRELLGLPGNKKILLFVADSITNKRKGLGLLVEALKRLTVPDIHLAILGSRSLDVELPKESFTTLGKINSETLMSVAYSASDLFVIPSIEDNLPNTVIESIACGTPVVGFNIGGVPDMIQDGQNGLLCKQIDSESLAKTIEVAMNSPFDNSLIRKDAVQRFDQNIQATNYIQLFHQLKA